MKQYILPFVCLLSSATVMGQAAKTSSTLPRLVGEAHWKFLSGVYVPQDSMSMDYYAPRPAEWQDGWDGEWRYDMKWLCAYDATAGMYYPPTMKGIMDYSGGGDLPSELVVQTKGISSVAWSNDSKAVFTYNAAGKLTSVVVYPWDAGLGDWRAEPNSRHTYTYNATNKRTSWLYEGYNIGAGAWQNGFKYTYNYDGSGNMTNATRQNWDYMIPGWVNFSKEVYTWDGSNNKTQTRFQSWGGSFWVNGSRQTYSGFHNHQPELILHEGYIESISGPFFYNSWQKHTTFNAEDQPVYQYEESWDVTASAWIIESGDMVTNWYYEPYSVTLPEVSRDAAGKMTLCPMPAHKELTIEMTWDEPKPFRVAIMDMQGRLRCEWNVAACTQYREVVPTSGLEPGNYIITMRGAKKSVSQQITVMK